MKNASFLTLFAVALLGTDPRVSWGQTLQTWGQTPQSVGTNPGERVGTGPETWFHVIGGNASKEGLTADLEAIRDAGISGIQFFHGGRHSDVTPWPGLEDRQIPCLSAAWDDLVAHAARECRRLGLTFKMQNCPGWSMAGGPWITDETAQRRLVGAATHVKADGQARAVTLKRPEMPHPKARDYHDVVVLAFPTVAGDAEGELVPRNPLTATRRLDPAPAAKPQTLDFAFDRPVTVRTLVLPSVARMAQQAWVCEPDLQLVVSVEQADGTWATVADRAIPRGNWEEYLPTEGLQSVALRACPTRRLRLAFSGSHPVHLDFVRFYAGARLDNWEAFAGSSLRALVRGADTLSARDVVALDAIRDVTAETANGVFTGALPPGDWTLLRVGHVNSGFENGPAPDCATGWECDKLDPRGIEANFRGYVGRLLDGPLASVGMDGILLDSWEAWRPDWTWRMEDYFRDLKGYDVRRRLPALFGYVIDGGEATRNFLRDWRDAVSTLIERNFYRRMAELAKERGLACQYETAFGDVLPGDILRYWKWADTPMCEFWYPHRDDGYVGSWQNKPVRPCVSAAHLYGKRRVAAEAFTSFELSWNESPRLFKRIADEHLARGVTHLVFHTYTHNPYAKGAERRPGTSFGQGIGSPFLRTQTWWPQMRHFSAYLTRCNALLEAGAPASDFLWYLGDGLDARPDDEAASCRDGLSFDLLNQDALQERLSVRDGRLVTSEGASWRFVYVPDSVAVLPATAKRFAELERAGARIVRGDADALSEACRAAGRTVEGDVLWLKRAVGSGAVFFVCPRQADTPFDGRVTFAATGKPRVYDPVSGTARAVAAREADGRTEVALRLAANESCFVLFGDARPPKGTTVAASDAADGPSVALSDWTVAFPSGHGVTCEPFALKELKSLAELPNVPEEVRGFSGTCVYRATFDCREPHALDLDLGRVETVAEVSVNGTPVATLWTAPNACRIPASAVKAGRNELEVRVTTTWLNALVYEARGNGKSLGRWVLAGPNAGHPYLPSGLIGPVRLRQCVSEGFARRLGDTEKKADGIPFTVRNVYGSHMVVQRGKPIRVTGTAPAGADVEGNFHGVKVLAKAAASGEWTLAFPAERAGGPYTMTFATQPSRGPQFVFTDILVGDVWLATGQSNMEFPVWDPARPYTRLKDGDKIAASYRDDGIRLLRVANAACAEGPCRTLSGRPAWRPLTSTEAVANTSAVGLYFADSLRRVLREGGRKVPIGLVHANWGGSAIASWLPASGAYWNAMLAPVTALNVKGVIWYQGESDAGDAERYRKLQKELIDGWRAAWRDEALPFCLTALSSYYRHNPEHPLPDDFWKSFDLNADWKTEGWKVVGYAAFRQMQSDFLDCPHTGVACTFDVGEHSDIHPKDKRTVGERLAHEALRVAYGDAAARPGPRVKAAVRDGAAVVVSFRDTGAGLTARGGAFGERLWALKDAAGRWFWAEAELRPDATVRVASPEVAAPTAVQYAYTSFHPAPNFCRADDGLPVFGFRVDVKAEGAK